MSGTCTCWILEPNWEAILKSREQWCFIQFSVATRQSKTLGYIQSPLRELVSQFFKLFIMLISWLSSPSCQENQTSHQHLYFKLPGLRQSREKGSNNPLHYLSGIFSQGRYYRCDTDMTEHHQAFTFFALWQFSEETKLTIYLSNPISGYNRGNSGNHFCVKVFSFS